MSGMVGFAKQANTTGGNGGEVVTVNTVADLKKYMEDDKARTVKLGANLSADSKVTINFGANKTLLGTDRATACTTSTWPAARPPAMTSSRI